eukprot:8037780-Heterocapsa_arctica.AAC.1
MSLVRDVCIIRPAAWHVLALGRDPVLPSGVSGMRHLHCQEAEIPSAPRANHTWVSRRRPGQERVLKSRRQALDSA